MEGNIECEGGVILCVMGFCVVVSFGDKAFSKFSTVNTFYLASGWETSFMTFIFCLFRVQVQHTEVPRLGVESELQVLATATAMPDLSCIFGLHTTAHDSAPSLTH